MSIRNGQPVWRAWSNNLFTFFLAAGLTAILSLPGCGGGYGSSMGSSASGGYTSTPTSTTGAALLTLTDMPGDLLSYMVNVVSLQLTRDDGTVVATVLKKTQIDFAQLVTLSEAISAQQIPAGKYVSAALTLDFTGATIVVDNGAGGLMIPAMNILNGNDNSPLVSPNNQITVSIKLPTDKPFIITAGTISHLAVDFNLAASNTVSPATITSTTAAASVMVTVNPVLSASLVPDTSKPIRVRGPLVSVTNTATETSYTINVRPFFDDKDDEGKLVVNTTSKTMYSINGMSYMGTAGLTALSSLIGAFTSATGTFDVPTKTFTADTVTVGGNHNGAKMDSFDGTVIARSGNVLTVSDGLIEHESREGAEFSFKAAVTVADTTSVTEDGQTGTFKQQDISVGQRAKFFGTLGTDSSGNTTLDATQGSAILRITSVTGQAGSSTSNSVTLMLQSLGGQPAAEFDFKGTGTAMAQDATVDSYVVGVPAALLATPVTGGTELKFLGFVAPFMSGPPHFNALTLENFANTVALLRLEWSDAGITAPFVSPLSATHVALSQSTLQSASRHEVRVGPQRLDPSTLTGGLTLAPNTSAGFTAFVIRHSLSEKIDTYSSFGDLVAALASDLNGTTALRKIAARGPYDATTGIFSVNQLFVSLND